MTKIYHAATALLILTCGACGNKGDIYPVSGKVTHMGAPAAGAVVFFKRQGDGTSNEDGIMGIVQDNGSFELTCGSRGKGAPSGQYDVLVVWRGETAQGGRCCHRHGPDRLGGRYSDPQHPQLHATIEAKATDLPPFELTH